MRNCISKLVALVFIPGLLLAQQKDVKFTKSNFSNNPNGFRVAMQKIAEGNQYIQDGQYAAAVACYLVADSVNPDNADLNAKIGVCYLNGVNKAKCLPYFRTAYQIKKNISSRIEFFLARGYHLNSIWDSATIFYQLALKSSSSDKDEINKGIEECTNGAALMQHPVKVTIENIGNNINSIYSEFRPVITDNGRTMVFTSRRRSSLSADLNLVTGEYPDDIYMSHFRNGVWDTAVMLDPPINTVDNDDAAYLSADGNTLYLVRDNRDGDIYKCAYSEKKGWSLPVALSDTINTIYAESSMCLSPDGKTMFFISSRPGGVGKKDIYTCTKLNDSVWGSPVNIGNNINTPEDEDGVFMNPDGKSLYFSSKGHNSMGGYDIYMTVNDNGKWSDPVNLGYPINTPDDDVYFSTSHNGYYGYYARTTDNNRLDIFRVTMTAFMPKEWAYAGGITDSISHTKLKATVEFLDKSSGKLLSSDTVVGEYDITMPAGHNYTLRIRAKGYNDYIKEVNIPDTAIYQNIVQNVAMVTYTPPKPLMADSCIPSMAIIMERFKGGEKDTTVMRNAIAHLDGSLCLKDMRFTVQLGAFRSIKGFNYKKYVKEVKTETAPDGMIHVTSGSFPNYREARKYLESIKKKGLKDAWIMGMYNGKRYVLKELLHHS